MAKISFYFDEMMPRVVVEHLNSKGYEAVMAVDVGMTEKDDMSEHLAYTTEHNFMLVTFDRAFAGKASKQTDHAGVLCWTGVIDDFGGMMRKFSEFAEEHSAEEVAGQVFWKK